ncbi:MAG TPA: hypothetical protein VKT80_19180, partial [Chloroflexota bacterium]|nr:hypothetical protein [Chloroflexota bacterium]
TESGQTRLFRPIARSQCVKPADQISPVSAKPGQLDILDIRPELETPKQTLIGPDLGNSRVNVAQVLPQFRGFQTVVVVDQRHYPRHVIDL